MKFLLDHDVPAEVAQLLVYWGHDVQTVKGILPITTPDPQIFATAQASARILVSCNRNDFLELSREALSEHQPFAGLVVLIRRRTRQGECAHVLGLLRRAGPTGLAGNINFA